MSALRKQIDGILGVEPDAHAVEFEREWKTWDDLREGMAALDTVLTEGGLVAATRVGVVLRNRPEHVCTILEVVSSRRCLVTLNPVYPDDRLAEDIERVGVPVVIASSDDWRRAGVEAAARSCGALGIEAAIVPHGPPTFRVGLPANPALRSKREAAGIAIEMLTSGTTGTPKRIPLPRQNFERAVLDWSLFEKGRGADVAPRLRSGVQIVHTSFAHIGGIGGMLNVVLAGRKFCLLERFNVEEFHDAVLRHRPKVANGPPAVLRMLLDAQIPREDFASIVTFRTGTAPLDPSLAEEFYEHFGIPVLQNYGATEFAGGVAGWTMDDFKTYHAEKRGSVGRLNPGIEGRTVDADSGQPLLPGEEGVLELKAPHLGDGQSWLRTTDLSVVDADRFLWIRGRADNVINRGGYKVNPDEVVRALEQHPAVREAAVIAMPEPRLGQVPIAALTLRPNVGAPSSEELNAFLRKTLLPYQVPVRFDVVAELPRTASMKVDQTSLRKMLDVPAA